MTEDNRRAWAVIQLQQKAAELGCLPKKADFDEASRSRIKNILGPWPRALEAAGLKPPKPATPTKKNQRSQCSKNS